MKIFAPLMILLCLPTFVFARGVVLSKQLLDRELVLNFYAKKSNGLINYSKAYLVKFTQVEGRVRLVSHNGELNYDFEVLSRSNDGVEINFKDGLHEISFQSSIFKTELPLSHPQLKRYILPAKAFKEISIEAQNPEELVATVYLNVAGYEFVRMQLVPDNSSRFVAKLHTDEDKVGVYATYPQEDGKKYAGKQTLPATYEYDKNFPAELIPVLKDAVHYWNKALGGNYIKLIQTTDSTRAQKVGVNYIDYYSDRDDDGGARGVFNLHPRNGKILSSYIYVPSGFKVWGTKYLTEKFPNIGREKIERAVKDYLTHTLAHEIGHSLGLRHNFAASNESNLTSENFERIFSRYLNKGKLSKRVKPSSSAMDYISIDYFTLMGAKMRLHQAPLSYDKKASRWLYFNERPKSFGSYCTHFDEPPTVENGGSSFCQAWDQPHLLH